jgi:hypothetical protein
LPGASDIKNQEVASLAIPQPTRFLLSERALAQILKKQVPQCLDCSLVKGSQKPTRAVERAGSWSRPKRAIKGLAKEERRVEKASRVRSPLMAYPSRTATKSMTS